MDHAGRVGFNRQPTVLELQCNIDKFCWESMGRTYPLYSPLSQLPPPIMPPNSRTGHGVQRFRKTKRYPGENAQDNNCWPPRGQPDALVFQSGDTLSRVRWRGPRQWVMLMCGRWWVVVQNNPPRGCFPGENHTIYSVPKIFSYRELGQGNDLFHKTHCFPLRQVIYTNSQTYLEGSQE